MTLAEIIMKEYIENCFLVERMEVKYTQITAEIEPIDDYRTSIRCIENKKADKNGRFRKTKTLTDHNTHWLYYMLVEYGFIRKSKVTE